MRHPTLVILADTSAWVEYLRKTGSDVHLRLHDLISEEADIVTTEVVVMEVLAGALNDEHRERLRRLLRRFTLLPVGDLATYKQAAELHLTCRRKGETVRKLTACLIAAVAIRDGAAILHLDADFTALARHTSLQLAGPS